MASALENAYWKAVCETDAAWEEYCRCLTDDMWKVYVKAQARETEFFNLLSPCEAARIREENK